MLNGISANSPAFKGYIVHRGKVIDTDEITRTRTNDKGDCLLISTKNGDSTLIMQPPGKVLKAIKTAQLTDGIIKV